MSERFLRTTFGCGDSASVAWSRWPDSNRRRNDYQPFAFHLSYTATGAPYGIETIDLLLTMETLCRLS